MIMNNRLLALFCMVLAVLPERSLYAQGTSMSLNQAIEFALKNNGSIKNAELDIRSALAKKQEVTGIGLPQLSGSFDVKDFLKIPVSLVPAEFFGGRPGEFLPVQFGTKYNATAGVNASQLIFSSDYIVGLQASKTFMELSSKSLQRSQTEVKAAVTKAYYGVLVNEKRLAILEINRQTLSRLLADAKEANKAGFVEAIDVARLELTYNNLVTEKEKVARLAGIGSTLLKFQMGMDISQSISLSDSLIQFEKNLNEVNVPAKPSVSNRIEYSLLETSIKLNKLDLKRQQLGYSPSLVAYGALSANALRQEFDIFSGVRWFPTAIVGATLNVSLFDGLQRNNRVQQAKISIQKSENDLKNFEQAAGMEVLMADAAYKNALESMKTQQRNIVLAREVFEVTTAKYREGIGSNTDMLNAEAAFKEAQTNYYQALYDALVAKTDLDKATGTLK